MSATTSPQGDIRAKSNARIELFEENIKKIAEKVDEGVRTRNFPEEMREIYHGALKSIPVFNRMVQTLSEDPATEPELIRVEALRKENLRHVTILAPVFGERPPSPRTAFVMGLTQNQKSSNSPCCYIL